MWDINVHLVSMIAIHGLDTESPKTWVFEKDDGSQINWSSYEEMLPAAIPEARIYTYDWNAKAFDNAPVQTLLGHADTLLGLITAERGQDAQDRPLLFVASCFGGLVLAEGERVEEDKADVKALVKAALSRDEAGPWLLIIDNADDTILFAGGQLLSYLSFSRQGSILFTTRNHQAAARLQARQGVYRLLRLSDSESGRLLHQGLQLSQVSDLHSTTKLLEYLTYLPLAIK
ncbi:kinesin light chain 3 [Apiospora marii]|uniref:kinesin light chain 3 n=1 Tax=Apiospora marii TaxID=335849 RepID=UPI00312CD8CB